MSIKTFYAVVKHLDRPPEELIRTDIGFDENSQRYIKLLHVAEYPKKPKMGNVVGHTVEKVWKITDTKTGTFEWKIK